MERLWIVARTAQVPRRVDVFGALEISMLMSNDSTPLASLLT